MVQTKFRTPPGPLRPTGRPALFSRPQKAARVPVDAEVRAKFGEPAPPPASNEPLYRMRAVESLSHHWAGTIVLATRVPMRVAGYIALALVGLIGSLLYFGQYTRKVSVSGQIVPSAGSIKVVAHQFAVLTSKRVADGEVVKLGQPLFELTTERAGSAGNIDARIGALLQARTNELAVTASLQASELEQRAVSLAARQRSIQAEVTKRLEQVMLQKMQVGSAQTKQARYQNLAKKGFMSPAQLADLRDEVTAQIARQRALESEVLAVQRELLAVQEESVSIANKIKLSKSQAAQNLATLGQEAAEHEGRSRMMVLAPAAGALTAISVEPGQSVSPGATLATILPVGSELEAHLSVPSRAIGFIERGQRVLLRMSSFPHQKFGQVAGVVARVERSPIAEPLAGTSAEPMYRITVRLATQSVTAYGRTQHFKAGMTLEADILQERRRLIEWVIEPLLSAGGRVGR
ncbi:MAG: HlyD family efflux transporter periplasmic adaptor subunit [Pseudomonadota bacterium]